MPANDNPRGPHLGMLALEPLRAMLEFARMRFTDNDVSASGDGHAVVFFPASAPTTASWNHSRKHCERLGYSSHHWGRGVNTGPSGDPIAWMRELADEIADVVAHERNGVTLVGWSLGGLYAREIAKAIPTACAR